MHYHNTLLSTLQCRQRKYHHNRFHNKRPGSNTLNKPANTNFMNYKPKQAQNSKKMTEPISRCCSDSTYVPAKYIGPIGLLYIQMGDESRIQSDIDLIWKKQSDKLSRISQRT